MDIKEARLFDLHKRPRHFWELARAHVITSLIKNFHGIGKNSVVLDFGCGDGYMIERLSKKLPDSLFMGVDEMFDDAIISGIKARVKGETILAPSLSELESRTGRKAGIALMLDVLEHCENDLAAASSVAASGLVDKNTLFFVSVPAFRRLFGAHDRSLGHYRRYSLPEISAVLEKSGFRIIDSGYFFFSLLMPRFLMRLAEGDKTQESVLLSRHHPFLEGIAKILLIIDYHASQMLKKSGIRLWGLSCYAVCRKA